MAMYITDDALCLRVHDFSETSQVVTVLTREHGLVPLIAKGSKRQTKKNTMSGPLDLLTSGQVVFIPSKGPTGAELGTLAAWELTDHRNTLRSNLKGLNAAYLATELTTQLLHPNDPHPEILPELEAALALFPTAHGPRALVSYAKLLLSAAGYAPQFALCTACQRPLTIDTTVVFSPRHGGLVCCNRTDVAGIALPAKVLLALDRLPPPSAILANPPDRAADPSALASAMNVLLAHAEHITGRQLRTRDLVNALFR